MNVQLIVRIRWSITNLCGGLGSTVAPVRRCCGAVEAMGNCYAVPLCGT